MSPAAARVSVALSGALWVALSIAGCASASPSSVGTTGGTGAAATGSAAGAGTSAGASGAGASGSMAGSGTVGAATGAGAGAATGAGAGAGAGASAGAGAGSSSGGSAAGTGNNAASGTGAAAPDAGGSTDAATGAGQDGATPSLDGGSWPPVADYAAAGPFMTTRDVNTGPAGAYDIFRPATLGGGGLKHPIVSWANGTNYKLDSYAPLLTHWASHGLVVIAGHTQTTAGGATIKAAVDWMLAQAANTTSPFFGVLDVHAIAASGHSQGGGATIAAGAGAPGPVPLTTTLPLMPYLGFEKDLTIIGRQTAPMGNIVATNDTTAPGAADQIYQNVNTELVQPEFIGVHTDSMNPAMFGPTLAWLRFRLMGDAQARTWFYPAGTCGLCTNAAWKTVRYKNTP